MFRFVVALVLVIVFAAPSHAQSTAYSDGLADRTAYETWISSLETGEKTGAAYWAGQRSLPHPGPCGHTDAPSDAGCREAQRRLAPADVRRRSEPDYRQGWNAFQSTTAPDTTTAADTTEDDSAWYGVAGNKCVSAGAGFADPQLWAEEMRQEGAIVLDKSKPNDSDKGSAEFLVSFRGETKGILFYQGKKFCADMASLIQTMGMMPWQFRQQIAPEIKRRFSAP
ncbi:MAG: hypothetical protein ABSC06_32750 [Rhodopila sp.]